MIDIDYFSLSFLICCSVAFGFFMNRVHTKSISEYLSQQLIDSVKRCDELLLKTVKEHVKFLNKLGENSEKELEKSAGDIKALQKSIIDLKEYVVLISEELNGGYDIKKELENEITKLKNILKRKEKHGY